jgi:hypothetical protein
MWLQVWLQVWLQMWLRVRPARRARRSTWCLSCTY